MVVDEYLSALELKEHELVLDLGCVNGAIARMMASRDNCIGGSEH
jgi:cyclopropane fatty-acyl-phospholipid synthase-like methyltransferase